MCFVLFNLLYCFRWWHLYFSRPNLENFDIILPEVKSSEYVLLLLKRKKLENV